MNNPTEPSRRPALVIRWMARISGSLFIVLFLAVFIPDWMQKGTMPIPSDRMPMILSLLLAFMGLMIAWKWEGTGGAVALAGVILYGILGLQTDIKPGATILLTATYGLPAVLFLIYWWKARRLFSVRKNAAV